MDPKRWQQVQNLVDQLFDTPLDQREALLKNACQGDSELEQEVRSLLDADQQSNEIFNKLAEPSDNELTQTIMQAAKSFDEYQIIRKIGIGGMGIVYQALDIRLERYVALKYLSPKLLTDTKVRDRFKAEARAASRIDHPNVCAIYDVGETVDDQLYFTMPYYEGSTLETLITNRSLTLQSAVSISLQIAQGLKAAHQHKILHRDIKPGNIFITSNNIVKILDFGIAKHLDGETTTTGIPFGSTAYMSPEQSFGRTLNNCADIWSFGVVMYEMLTHELPFKGDTHFDLTQAILNNPTPKVSALLNNCPPLLCDIISKALTKETSSRYQTVEELLQDLIKVNDRLSTTNQAEGDGHCSERKSISSTTMEKARSHKVSSTSLDPEKILQVEKVLIELMGPAARVLIKRNKRKATSIKALCEALLPRLNNKEEEHYFINAVKPYWS